MTHKLWVNCLSKLLSNIILNCQRLNLNLTRNLKFNLVPKFPSVFDRTSPEIVIGGRLLISMTFLDLFSTTNFTANYQTAYFPILHYVTNQSKLCHQHKPSQILRTKINRWRPMVLPYNKHFSHFFYFKSFSTIHFVQPTTFYLQNLCHNSSLTVDSCITSRWPPLMLIFCIAE